MESYTAREVVRRGKEFYERHIRAQVEPEHEGRFLVVDVIGGEYALADDELEAFDRAREKAPEGVLYLIRVGHKAAHRIGAGHPGPPKSGSLAREGAPSPAAVRLWSRSKCSVRLRQVATMVGTLVKPSRSRP